MAYENLKIIKSLINNPNIKKKTQKDTEDDLLRTSLVTITDPISQETKVFSSANLNKNTINNKIFPFFEDANIRNYVIAEANQNNFLCAGRTQLITSFNATGITFPNPKEEKTSVEFIKNLNGSYTVKETVVLPKTFNITGNKNTLTSLEDCIASAILTSTISSEGGVIKHTIDDFSFIPNDLRLCDKVLASPLGESLAEHVDRSYLSEKKDKIDIRSITWNIGGKTPTHEAIETLAEKLKGADVIAIGTQEENGKDKNRLHEQLLKMLNKSVISGGQYKIVEADGKNYRLTTAGGVLTGKQHTRTTVIVKEPYDFDPPPTVTVVNDLKSQKSSLIPIEYNKTIIDISGTLKFTAPSGKKETIMDVNIASGHMESNSEGSRRDHTNSYLDKKGMLKEADTFNEIVQEASRVRIFMGDTNERDHLMADRTTKNPGETMNMRGLGFDTQKVPASTSSFALVSSSNPISIEGKVKGEVKVLDGINKLEGSYGVCLNEHGTQEIKKCKKNKDRPHVTEGGHLDRVAISTGRDINDTTYETVVDGVGFNKKGKIRYWGSDHAPVIRSTKINTKTAPNKLVANFINSRIPDFSIQLADIQKVQQKIRLAITNGAQNTAVTEGIKSIKSYDDQSDNKTILKKYFGIDIGERDNTQSILDSLKTTESKLQRMCDNARSLKTIINALANKNDLNSIEKSWLILTYNKISSLNRSRNEDALIHRCQNEIFSNFDHVLQELAGNNPSIEHKTAASNVSKPISSTNTPLSVVVMITDDTLKAVKRGDVTAIAKLNNSLSSTIKQLPLLLSTNLETAKKILDDISKSFEVSFDNSYKAMTIGILSFISSSLNDAAVKELVTNTNNKLKTQYSNIVNNIDAISSRAYDHPNLRNQNYFELPPLGIVPIKDIPPLLQSSTSLYANNPLLVTISSQRNQLELASFIDSNIERLIKNNNDIIKNTIKKNQSQQTNISKEPPLAPFHNLLNKGVQITNLLMDTIISPVQKENSKLEQDILLLQEKKDVFNKPVEDLSTQISENLLVISKYEKEIKNISAIYNAYSEIKNIGGKLSAKDEKRLFETGKNLNHLQSKIEALQDNNIMLEKEKNSIIKNITEEVNEINRSMLPVNEKKNTLTSAVSTCNDYHNFIQEINMFTYKCRDLQTEEGINSVFSQFLYEATQPDSGTMKRECAESISSSLNEQYGNKPRYTKNEINDTIETIINNKTFAFVNNDLPKISEQVIKKEPKFVTNFKKFINKISQFFIKKDAFIIYEDRLNTLVAGLKDNTDTPESIATPNTPKEPDSTNITSISEVFNSRDNLQVSNNASTPEPPKTPLIDLITPVTTAPPFEDANPSSPPSIEATPIFASTSYAYSTPETPSGNAFSEDLSLQIGEYGNSFNFASTAQKDIDSLLSDKAKEELYKRTSPIEKTKAREDFISYLEKKFDSMPRCQVPMNDKVAKPQQAVTSIKELFANDKKGIQLFERAIAEEKTSKDYRNAVFLASHKSCGENKWKDRLAIMVSAPSGSGKSFLSQRILNAIDDTINGGNRKTFNEKKGVNSVIVIDGDIERDLSQMRQLLLQVAIKKGFSGIKDLQAKTDAGFKIKDMVLATAKVQSNFNICVNTSHDKHYFSDLKQKKAFDPLPLKEVLVTLSGSDPKKTKENAMLAENTNALISNADDFTKYKTQQIDLHNNHICCPSKEPCDPSVYDYGYRNAAVSTKYFTDKINNGASNRVVIDIENDIIRVKYTSNNDITKIRECSPLEKHDLIMSVAEFNKYNKFISELSTGHSFTQIKKGPIEWLEQHRAKNPGNLTIKSICGERNLNKLVEEGSKDAMTSMLDNKIEQKMSQVKKKISKERELPQQQKPETPEDLQSRLD